jgi:hypothetical protein
MADRPEMRAWAVEAQAQATRAERAEAALAVHETALRAAGFSTVAELREDRDWWARGSERARALHQRGQDNLAERLGLAVPDLCLADGETWPCPTVAALDAQRPAEPCICGTPGTGNFEGPLRDCPVHGEQPSTRPPAEPYCFCADCIRCGCGMWEKHHADASEIVPQSAPWSLEGDRP